MGIDTNSLPFILDAKNAGADFSRTLTIGWQNYYRLSPQLVELELRRARMPATAEEIEIFLFPASVRRWVVPPTQHTDGRLNRRLPRCESNGDSRHEHAHSRPP
jgi:hypothetical protein